MSGDENNNFDSNVLPYADDELDIGDNRRSPIFDKNAFTEKAKPVKARHKRRETAIYDAMSLNKISTLSYIYFENTYEDNNFIKLIPYTGPCNTMHLGHHLYIPQLASNKSGSSTVSYQRFLGNYEQAVKQIEPTLKKASLSIYLRFGVSYVLYVDPTVQRSMMLSEYFRLRNRGKQIKTAFYTCKGVTSPKKLVETLNKHNYHQVSSNTYSYDIQLYQTKASKCTVLHFLYDEKFECHSILYRPQHPYNFDFIRDKSSSIFESVNDSYSDIFDYRIQLNTVIHLSEDDPIVKDVLRGVPVNQVISVDTSTHLLHIAKNLQTCVKYLKCTRSSNYQNSDEPILISIGTYEEFQLDEQGRCLSLMTSSNMITIEYQISKTIPPADKLCSLGLWFSKLLQTCVDLPAANQEKNSNKFCKWLCDTSIFRRKYQHSLKQMDVKELTRYKAQTSNNTFTSEDIAFVRNILQDNQLKKNLFSVNSNKCDRIHVDQKYNSTKERLVNCCAPSAKKALAKVEHVYSLICEQFNE